MKNLRGTITILRKQLVRQLEDGSLQEAFDLVKQKMPVNAYIENFDAQLAEQTTWPKKVVYWRLFSGKPARCTAWFTEDEQ